MNVCGPPYSSEIRRYASRLSVRSPATTRILSRCQDVISELQRDAAARMDELLSPKVSPAEGS